MMEQFYQFLAGAPFPEGTSWGVREAGAMTDVILGGVGLLSTPGYLVLKPGDYVLMRDMHGNGQPVNDSLQLWVTAQ